MLGRKKVTSIFFLIIVFLFGVPWGATNSSASVLLLAGTIIITSFWLSKTSLGRPCLSLFAYTLIQNFSYFALNTDYSVWQFFRSGVPFLSAIIALPCGLGIARSNISEKYYFSIFAALTIGCVLQVIIFYIGIPIVEPNALIITGSRIYSAPFLFMFPLLYFFLEQKRYLYSALVIFVLFASGSKAVILGVLILILVMYIFLATKKLGSIQLVGASIIMLVSGVFALQEFGDRFVELLEHGDSVRLFQAKDAFAQLDNFSSFIFGKSFGIPVLQGFFAFDASDLGSERLFENSRYDLDNGVVTIPLKLGVVGTVLLGAFLIKLVSTKRERSLLLVILFSNLLASGGILFSADGAFALLILGLVIGLSQKWHGVALFSNTKSKGPIDEFS